jgi:hypothetical protein
MQFKAPAYCGDSHKPSLSARAINPTFILLFKTKQKVILQNNHLKITLMEKFSESVELTAPDYTTPAKVYVHFVAEKLSISKRLSYDYLWAHKFSNKRF